MSHGGERAGRPGARRRRAAHRPCAVRLLAAVVALSPAPAVSASHPAADLGPIRQALQRGQTQEAIRRLQEIHRGGTASAESYTLLGRAYQARLDEVGLLAKRGVAGRLRAALEAALELDPEHVAAHEELADFYFFAPAIVGGSKRRAGEQLDALARSSPYDAHRVRGRHAYSGEEYEQAERHFSAALALEAGDPQVWLGRADARMRLLERDAGALADYERALAMGYDEPVVYYQIGRLCVRLGDCPERGEEALQHFVAHSQGREQSVGRYRLALLYESSGRLAEALEQARLSAEVQPGEPRIRELVERLEEAVGGS